eukprot:2207291-Karenia_brevis.AAC.1
MQMNCEDCMKCWKCHKLQAKNIEQKCRRHQNCISCYAKQHHGIALDKRTNMIIKKLEKLWKKDTVTSCNDGIQEAPTSGTAVSQSTGKLRPPTLARTAD